MGRLMVIGVLLSMIFSGCFSPADQQEEDDPDPSQREPWSVGYGAEGCRLVVAVVQRPMDVVAGVLPDGFSPADAQGLLGTPVATGNAAVLVGAYRCETGELEPSGLSGMELNVFIEAPDVAGERSGADSDFYLLDVATGTEALAALLEQVGWPVTRASLTVQVDALPGGVLMGEASVNVDDDEVFGVEGLGAVESALSGLSRFWHATPDGVSYFEFEMDAEARVGVGTCTLGDGTTAAVLVGGTQCPLGDTAMITVHDFGWDATFHHLPGVYAGS